MFYSFAHECEIGFIACVCVCVCVCVVYDAVDIGFRCVVIRLTSRFSVFPLPLSLFECTAIPNRGARKCQSHRRHVLRLQRVSHRVGSGQRAGNARGARRARWKTRAKSGKNGTTRKKGKGGEGKKGELFRNFCWLETPSSLPAPPRAERSANRVKK